MSPSTIDVFAAAQAEVAALTPATAKGISEEQIAEKVGAGLSREQAIEVIERQRAHDATLSDAKSGGGNRKKPAEGK